MAGPNQKEYPLQKFRGKMKKITILTIILALCGSIFFPIAKDANAETTEEFIRRSNREIQKLADELDEIRRQLNAVEQNIANEEAKQQNLSTSISYLTYQIQSAELTIQQKEGEIERNQKEITVLGVQIDQTQEQIRNLKEAIKHLEEVVKRRTQASYKNSKISLIEIVATSENFSAFIKKLKYFTAIRTHDLELMGDLQDGRNELTGKKNNLTSQRAEVERLKAEIEFEKEELEKAKENLAWQKNQKSELLAQSEHNESAQRQTYAELDEEYKKKNAELIALQTSLAQAAVSGTEVEKGWIIGLQGATGWVVTYKDGKWLEGDGVCEGYHSHFFVMERKPDSEYWYYVNPHKYLDSGKLRAPFDNYWISQEYGENPGWYGAGGHPALDLVPTGGCGTPVLAAGDGLITFGYDYYHPGLNDPNGSYYAIINHGEIDGVEVKTGYWHLQYP